MATALVLQADKGRENGRWAYKAVGFAGSGNGDQQWRQRLAEAGVVLDYLPDLAPQVVAGDLALRPAYERADELHRSEQADGRLRRDNTP